MQAEISKKEMEFLNAEISSWADDGIITHEQAENILSLYAVKSRNLRLIMFSAGIVLLSLGAISFIMAHWHELGKIFRVCIISAAYIASLSAYIFTRKKYFLLLASGIFGGGIYLITHMYDIEITLADFLTYWLIEAVITSAITRDEWQMYLAQALALIWMIETVTQ